MELEQQLTIEDIKRIIADIEEEERKKSGFNGNLLPLTAVQYYKDSFKNRNFTLEKKIESLILPLRASGFYDYPSASTVIFLKSYKKIINPNYQLFKLIRTCYHEIRHNLQEHLVPYSFTKFACDIDSLRANFNRGEYRKKHDSFYLEIDADSYSLVKTKEYLQKKTPETYKKKEKHISYLETISLTNFLLYDLVNSIENVASILKVANFSYNEKEDVSPVLNVFFNDNNSFKSVKEIMEHKNFSNLDNRIVYSFLSCRSFLKNLNFDNLSDEELKLLDISLRYTCDLYTKQQEYLENMNISKKEKLIDFLNSEQILKNKIGYLKLYLNEKIEFRNRRPTLYRKHKLHKKKIPEYLEKTSSLLDSKKNNGFVIINILYLVCLIISLGVIGYIILF